MMAIKRRGILLLVLVVVLLTVVSSRVAPEMAARPDAPKVTDDPIPTPSPADSTPEPTPEPTPTPPNIREILPGVSRNDWNLRLVNNLVVLPSSFAPDVTAVGDGQYFSSQAVDALNAMLDGVKAQGYSVCIRTGYRPFSTQAYLFNGRASQIQWGTTMTLLEAEAEARKVVAYPGTSEHQLGLAVDLMDSASTSMVAEEVEDLPLLLWLKEHCAEYGFIQRYPKGKEELTGWYEPWHFRYVGTDCAAYITENDLCLEEFLALF